jgi:hypothetical protein
LTRVLVTRVQAAGHLIFGFAKMRESLFLGMEHVAAMKASPFQFSFHATPRHNQWIVVAFPGLVAAVMTDRAVIAIWLQLGLGRLEVPDCFVVFVSSNTARVTPANHRS